MFGQTKNIEHIVKKGENVYRLSLKYGVSINDIYELNPGSQNVIKIGEILLIPSNKSDDNNFENLVSDVYLVKKGETKYGLSKKFGVSIAELENTNPIIKNGLQAGHRLEVPRSNQATTTSSKADGSHKVLKGETLWGISRQYNMSLEALKNLNKANLGPVLLEGQVLLVNTEQVALSTNNYTVQKGDTKFGLSKKFNKTIDELERLNPSIVAMLKAGDVIVFKSPNNPISKINTPKIEADLNTILEDKTIDDDYTWYVIKPKETLYSLSKKTNMTINELTALNPKLREVFLAGDSIKIKGLKPSEITTIPALAKLENKFKTKVFWQTKTVDLNENESKNMIDYTYGIQNAINEIAINSAYNNTVTISDSDVTFNDLNPETSEMFYIKPQPTFGGELSKLGEFEIKFLENGESRVKQIRSLVSDDQMKIKMLSFLKAENANIICIYDSEYNEDISVIESTISDVKLIKLNKNGAFRPNELKNSLDSQKKNYVIIESKKTGVYLSASNLLLKELSRFDIQLAVLNQKNIPQESDVSVKRFKILKLIYPMAYNPNFIAETDLVKQIGFMINYDILKRISSQGLNAFDKVSEVSGTKFNYKIDGNLILNTAVSIFIYSENSNAELLGIY